MAAKKGNQNRKTHGMSRTRLYRVWKSMRCRCNWKNHPEYMNYGGRGITICKEWDDFRNFYDWAISVGYDEKAKYLQCTLDRIDVNGNYQPSNCRFVDISYQNRNRRTNKKYELNGKFYTLPDLADMSNKSRDLLYDRIVRRGWDVEKAITR